MLVLSRRVGESILIGQEITLTVLEVNGQKVRLGIRAPEGVRILREELAPFTTWTSETCVFDEPELLLGHSSCRDPRK